MSTASGSAFLLWAILSVLFLFFLVYHLWSYDRFKCLHWSSGRQPGAFKRVMTYSYLFSVPLLAVFSISITVIKFKEGYIITPTHEIVPKPLHLYSSGNRHWIIPLDFVFSAVWALELVTHLEELAFWLYLLHQNDKKAEWFSSWEYRLWYLGSVVSVVGLPLTTLITRKNIETCDAYIFLVGASGSTVTTVCFLYVLWRFPAFIAHVKGEGADPTVVVRLATFYQLNLARVVFRFLFTIPLIIVALDGIVDGPHPINRSVFWTDFLHMVGGIGCFVSTTITLLIFFPRSIVKEAGYRPKAPTIAASSPKLDSSPNIGYAEWSPTYAQSSEYPEYFNQPASPQYVLDMRPEDMNQNYPYPQSLAVLSDGGARSMSDATGEWETDTESGEGGDNQLETGKYRGSVDSPPYPGSPGSPPALSQRKSVSAPVPTSPLRPQETQGHKSGTEPGSLGSPTRRPTSPTRNSERIETVTFGHRTHLRRVQLPPQPQIPPPSPPTDAPPVQRSGMHQRHPFTHSASSPQILTPPAPAQTTQHHHPPMTPADASPPPTRRPGQQQHRRHSSRRVSAASMMQSPAEILQGAGMGVGLGVSVPEVDEASTVTLRELPVVGASGRSENRGHQRTSSNLHPYVMTFTSPIDLVDIPPRDEFPRTM